MNLAKLVGPALGLPDGATRLREDPLHVALAIPHGLRRRLLPRGDLGERDADSIADRRKLRHRAIDHVARRGLLEDGAVEGADVGPAPVVLLAIGRAAE